MKLRNFILINSLVIALGVSTLFAGFFYYLHHLQKNETFDQAMKEKSSSLEAKYSHLKSKIEKISVWTRYFTQDYSVERISVNNATPLSFKALEEKASQMMELSAEIMQFQLLSPAGKELFRLDRVNQKILRVSANELEDHSTWESFQYLKSKPETPIHISNFDLKRSHGEIEKPYLPVLRISSPILVNGEKTGFVMINIDASTVLENFQTESKTETSNSYVINQSGGWMFGHKDLNWAHLFPETESESFAKYFPTTFASMRAGETGIISNIEGNFLIRPATLGENRIYFVYHPESVDIMGEQRKLIVQYSLIVAGVFALTFLLSFLVFHIKRRSLTQTLQLRENQIFLKDAEQQAKLGYWNFNFQTERTYISPQLKSIFGLKTDDRATLEKCFQFFLPDAEDRVRSAFDKLKKEMTPFDLIEKLRTHSGENLWIRISGNVQEVRQGQVFAAMGLFQDVTQLKEHEESLRKNERSHLENENQTTLEEMVKAIHQELGGPIAALQKELRFLESKLKENAQETQNIPFHYSVETFHSNLKKLTSMNNSLRRLSQNSTTSTVESCSLKQLAQEALEANSSTIQQASIEVRNCLKEQDQLLCNSKQVIQIFNNLLRNSSKALSDKKNAWIEIKAERKGEKLCVYFTDSGTGLKEDLQDKIFQSLMSSNKSIDGSGQGLHVCKSIMESHGGKLLLDKTSKHTCFVLEFSTRTMESHVVEFKKTAA